MVKALDMSLSEFFSALIERMCALTRHSLAVEYPGANSTNEEDHDRTTDRVRARQSGNDETA
jgi:hypothetical protein